MILLCFPLRKQHSRFPQKMNVVIIGWLLFSECEKKISVTRLQVWSIIIFISPSKKWVILLQEYSYQPTTANTLGHTTLTQDWTSASSLDIHLDYNHRQFASPVKCKSLNQHSDFSHLVSGPLARSWRVGYSDSKKEKIKQPQKRNINRILERISESTEVAEKLWRTTSDIETQSRNEAFTKQIS